MCERHNCTTHLNEINQISKRSKFLFSRVTHFVQEENLLTDALLRELISQMGNELANAADTYLEYPEKVKELPLELPGDYDGMDTLNPNPSIRDQEYLQHSTLWSHQRVNNNNNKGNDRHKIQSTGLKGIKDEKTENPLPAYCTPPNPCPVGYTSECEK